MIVVLITNDNLFSYIMEFCSDSSMKQQSIGQHTAPLGQYYHDSEATIFFFFYS